MPPVLQVPSRVPSRRTLVTARARRARSVQRSAAVATVALAVAVGASALASPASGATTTIFSAPSTAVLVPQDVAEARIAQRVAEVAGGGGLGTHYSIEVADAESGQGIYAYKPRYARVPASNTKLFTAVSALTVLTAQQRFATTVQRSGRSARVTFVSGGDPRLSNKKVKALAAQTAAALRAKRVAASHGERRVKVRLDDTVFAGKARNPQWRSRYSTSIIQPVRGTTRKALRSTDSAASAARYFAKRLDKALPGRWKVSFKGRAAAPGKAKIVATVSSATVGTLVRRMLTYSDNQVAEVLSRDVAVASGLRATFAGGARATTRAVRAFGVDLTGSTLADGSGLSPANLVTTRTIISLLRQVAASPDPAVRSILYAGELPLAGLTGTLATTAGRFTGAGSRCAIGAVTAKTGSLEREKALSGYTVGADGRLKVFSILVGGLTTSAQRARALTDIDRVAAAIHGCS